MLGANESQPAGEPNPFLAHSATKYLGPQVPAMIQPGLGEMVEAVIAQLHHYQVMSLRLTKLKFQRF